MKMRILILILSLFFPVLLSGQAESVVVEWDRSQNRLTFPHALYEDGDNTLPYLTRKLPWDKKGKLPVVSLKVELTSKPGLKSLGSVPLDHIQAEPLLEYALVREAGRSFVVIKILPFVISASGEIERVDRFDLQVEEKMALAPLRSESTGEWAEASVLASGAWFKIAIEEGGIHKLTYEQLQEIGIQNPASVRVYGSGARQLPEKFSDGYIDDLSAVPVYMDKGSDGMFSPGDFILFYAEGPVAWEYDALDQLYKSRLHNYSWKGFYFLTDSKGAALSPGDAELAGGDPTDEVDEYDFRLHFEEEKYNLIASGKEWYGDNYKVILEHSYPFKLPKPVSGENVKINTEVAVRSGVSSGFNVRANGTYLGNVSAPGTSMGNYVATFAYENIKTFNYTPQSDNLTVTLQYAQPDSDSEGWLNKLVINGRGMLSMEGVDELDFRDKKSSGFGKIARYRLAKGNGAVIWDISDPAKPLNVPYTSSGEDALFVMDAARLREYVAFDPDGSFPVPQYAGEGLGAIENQNLHGLGHPDMLIITPEELLSEAERLAEHREQNDGLSVEVVLQQEVFNEFSSGTPDVSAIRNFMKMFYDRAGGQSDYCRYLLLFGDGSYDNRDHPDKKDNPNLILSYQSVNSLSPTQSFVSDDFFGLLDTDESLYNGLLDIGIGRLPVSNIEEARNVVDKLISYSDHTTQGSWRNQISFIGDDEDSNIHMRQADELANYVNQAVSSLQY